MTLDAEGCYRAIQAKDPRFDGLFFVGVASTGVYCRCVCSARTPKRENCTFFASAALAEKAGFRPCLLCRPENAPGRARVDTVNRLASIAVRRIEDGALDEMGVDELASELGVGDRHLRRALLERFGVSPVELAQTQRLLTAKRLLTDTTLSIGEVAFASGFASLRRFNALFQERYRMSPTDLRKRRSEVPGEMVRCVIGYRPPYDWDGLIDFLSARTISGVEDVADGVYRRIVAVSNRGGRSAESDVIGWIAVSPTPGRASLTVRVSGELAIALPKILRRVRRLFDTEAEPDAIASVLGELSAASPGLRVPGAFDGFEMAVRAILGQQISVAAARTLAGRFAAAFGRKVETPFTSLTHAFPSATTVATLEPERIAELGVVGSRAKAIVALANAVTRGAVRLTPGVDAESAKEALTALPGIGEWTAEYVCMRALSYPDAFPHTDLGIMKALGTKSPSDSKRAAEPWRPWRAYAALHLWRSLEKQP